MSARAVHLVIDARPRGPRGPLAAEVVLGRSVLGSPARPGGRASCRRVSRSSSTRARRSTSGCASWPVGQAGAASCSSAGRRGRMPRSCGPIASTTPAGCGAACVEGDRRNPPCSGGSTGRNRCRPPTKS